MQAEFTVFKPVVGLKLRAIVSRVTPSEVICTHLGLQVSGILY